MDILFSWCGRQESAVSASGASAGRRNTGRFFSEKMNLRKPYFSREPACNYEVLATIYDKTKKETSNEISFFVVRSTGIEPAWSYPQDP